ncbi:50S ribosomal protein L13 [Corallococcus praedator]|uniref:Large ribosomal subunit protein uL13 n=1 Tax=Corallococcus praedator TaxID=2316724 RepID=A0ABX9QBS6_9BACT|nr:MULTISPECIES: 50S ribosomal protein L13 [Corallococcus]RKH03253.1 50S ribosomal protein L13 [Corallococcus sp. CA047B]RKH21434.1 50S ribosomal protein L13 [Corallococcus sp. CA031C]RKH95458.1 50S ribosomal protein L13 [Corallococcus praedator]
MSQKTYSAKAADIKRQWHVIDVSDKVLGRAASQIATLLKGKHKPTYTPSIDTGDHVIVINADKVKVTGTKETDKLYYRHPYAGFPGALKITNLQKLRAKHPEDVILNAVRRMLPRSALGRQMMTKLKVYAGDTHPHTAQQPVAYKVEA